MLGPYVRYHTTDPLHPTDGIILEFSLRPGRTNGKLYDTPRFDVNSYLSAAIAQPISSRLRLYLRGMTQDQLATHPSVRNYLGGETTIRGDVEQRDYGRRIVAGRAQLHLKTVSNWTVASDILHKMWAEFPIQALDFEAVFFVDAGAAGDPDFGWRRTRIGYGIGSRVIAPPRLVGHLDFGYSEFGGWRIYAGVGETL